ncbi:type II glyceraldehyde-3-phosphate dehydrogenase [Methanonatronarchaeum sp. AMET6-2]|uniref:type II glyceraldehyde-3-phosphate dehydrogenase n=1 Tax=Methanonatronarchaeum sp. AMET6-2 TaxID=2933293 RepID=UPI00121818AB|nr:type II glyceraldehyde-3-phosphate dehydrogenase [Methanonatronarchaeum sp. AMET6-2]RZN62606.1 MAG: type II glyceraldehyde-3-phosphate dehydrogenase [Methanonatronarchaeia archaeon]UOY09400.1 type II glyceraldehyde-3-phosphate dehydrogenase [Methanonatronarchaeum sp. AMET6-2]
MNCKVGINGFGTIGKRIADAVSLQDDMEVVGVSKTTPNYESKLALDRGYPLYCAIPSRLDKFKEEGMDVEGGLEDLVSRSDIIVDCTPGGVGAENSKLYRDAGVKAVYQGGEDHEVAGFSFNSQVNYREALGRDHSRVVSCNTTALCRTLYPLHSEYGVEKVRATMIRRGGDPKQDSRGPLNAIKPKMKVPSHHGPDVMTVIPDLDISTTAVKVPTTIMHFHSINVELEADDVGREEIINLLDETPRVSFVSSEMEIESTAQVIELARDHGRPRNDVWEIPVWRESINIDDGELYYFQAVHQESDVVPENIDAIRAMMELETEPDRSIEKTDKTLGLDSMI